MTPPLAAPPVFTRSGPAEDLLLRLGFVWAGCGLLVLRLALQPQPLPQAPGLSLALVLATLTASLLLVACRHRLGLRERLFASLMVALVVTAVGLDRLATSPVSPRSQDLMMLVAAAGFSVLRVDWRGLAPWMLVLGAALLGWDAWSETERLTRLLKLGGLPVLLLTLWLLLRAHQAQGALMERLDDLRGVAYFDPLTHLLNRRGAREHLERMQAAAGTRPLSIAGALLDLDQFKSVNDHYGHTAGDRVLMAVAEVAREAATHRFDAAVRLGGDEFLLLWFDCEARCAERRAQTLRRRLEARRIALEDGSLLRASGSIGVAVMDARSVEDVGSLIRAADAAMYDDKRERRQHWLSERPLAAVENRAAEAAAAEVRLSGAA
ncbi:MAG TPA: GGDEF domain-containing protein [Nevskiaceae bacterium]|nr:GGDEF domain-containing protein [Nevskiaceae bacterium]